MFDVLMGSRLRPRFRPGQGFLVAVLHGAMVAGVVQGVTVPAPSPPSPRVDTTVFMVEPPALPPSAPVFGEEAMVSTTPFEALPVPIDVPADLPPLTIGPALDPERIRRALAVGGPGSPAGLPGPGERTVGAGDVDVPAAAIHQPSPRYPPALRLAGIEGRVLVEFIIDTTGHLEPGSSQVLESSHRGFEAAALETLERSLFRPARIAGRPVRQRTLQAIAFRIRPD
jgi:protein TonB